jgi:CRISPR/Cas system CMR subunit Cmr6 (Cas7 group RAMP superfamily)
MTESNLDFYATYHGLTVKDVSRIGGERGMDVYSRLQLLTLTLPSVTFKEVGRSIYRDLVHRPGDALSTYDRELIASRQEQMKHLGLIPPMLERLLLMPDHSFAIQFTLTLAKAYLSKDDESLYIIDNPMAKDRVFRVPMVRSSSWKGTLRSAARLELNLQDSDQQMVRLFGSEKGETETKLKAGRLVFYTTFLNRIGLEMINPHDRKRKVGVNPILIESVPVGAQGAFSLLYAPFDLMTAPPAERAAQACADLEAVSKSLGTLMCEVGFSAKRTSGYGVIQDKDLSGSLHIKNGKRILKYPFSTFAELGEIRVREVCHLWQGEQQDE